MDDKLLNTFNQNKSESLADEQQLKNKFYDYVKEKFSIFAFPENLKNIEEFQGFQEMKERRVKLKSGYFVTDIYTSFCLY